MLGAVHDRGVCNAAILAFDRCLCSEVTIFYGSSVKNRRSPIDRCGGIADTSARPERTVKERIPDGRIYPFRAGLERWETGRDILRLSSRKRRDVLAGAHLERLIDRRLHFGRRRRRAEARPELNAVAVTIARKMAESKAQADRRTAAIESRYRDARYRRYCGDRHVADGATRRRQSTGG